MNIKKYIRDELDGTHWPDADVGDDLYYGIDFNYYLNKLTEEDNLPTLQAEEIIQVVWEVPTGINTVDEFIENQVGVVKLKTDFIGIYKIICKLTTVSLGKEQDQVIPMILTVY